MFVVKEIGYGCRVSFGGSKDSRTCVCVCIMTNVLGLVHEYGLLQ